jgi:hypothetical protein
MIYELRTYTATPGMMDRLHARFRDHTRRIFARHGIQSVGYWVQATPEDGAGELEVFPRRPRMDRREGGERARRANRRQHHKPLSAADRLLGAAIASAARGTGWEPGWQSS